MTKTLNAKDIPLWEALANLELGENIHPGRKRGYFLAREAMRSLFRNEGIDVPINELRLVQHKELIAHPDYTISLSHTPTWGAAILGNKKTYRSIGVDIESQTRIVKEMIKERIAHPEDIKLTNLELWCLKEASFKAIMNTGLFDRPFEFSDIQISSNTWSYSPANLAGEWALETKHEHLVARAWIKN